MRGKRRKYKIKCNDNEIPVMWDINLFFSGAFGLIASFLNVLRPPPTAHYDNEQTAIRWMKKGNNWNIFTVRCRRSAIIWVNIVTTNASNPLASNRKDY